MRKLSEIQEKAANILRVIDGGGSLELRELFPFLEEIRDWNDKEVDHVDAARLARLVYEAVEGKTHGLDFENIGTDLSFLLGAILKNTFVEWERDNCPPIYAILHEVFANEHPVWGYIAIHNPENRTPPGCDQ